MSLVTFVAAIEVTYTWVVLTLQFLQRRNVEVSIIAHIISVFISPIKILPLIKIS